MISISLSIQHSPHGGKRATGGEAKSLSQSLSIRLSMAMMSGTDRVKHTWLDYQ